MRYDLIAPEAVLRSIRSEGDEHPVRELIAAEPQPGEIAMAIPAKSNEQYAQMIRATLIAAHKATLQTVGELDISLAGEQTGWSHEVGSNAAQQALDQFSSDEKDEDEEEDSAQIEAREFSVDAFSRELNARGFPKDIAQSHAEVLGSLMDEDAPIPEGLSAVVEMRIDPQTQKLASAALHIARRGASKIATAEIHWVSSNGVAVPQTKISLGYLH
jgi:hypothetical protein